jgi:hypothetical protein
MATLSPPHRGRSGGLTIARVDNHGGKGSSAMQLGTPNDIDTQLSPALLWSTYELTI